MRWTLIKYKETLKSSNMSVVGVFKETLERRKRLGDDGVQNMPF